MVGGSVWTTRAGSGSDHWRREEREGMLETSESLVPFPLFGSWSQVLHLFDLRIQICIPPRTGQDS